MARAQLDPPEAVSLQEAAQRLALDPGTVAQIRSLLNGMALRWCGDEGVWYRLADVVAAVAWVRAEAAQALDLWADVHAPTADELFPLVDGDDDVDRMHW